MYGTDLDCMSADMSYLFNFGIYYKILENPLTGNYTMSIRGSTRIICCPLKRSVESRTPLCYYPGDLIDKGPIRMRKSFHVYSNSLRLILIVAVIPINNDYYQ